MERSPRKKFDLRNFLLPIAGLILIGVLFIPQIEELLGEGFDWTVGALGLAVSVLIVRAVLRKYPVEKEPEMLLPIYIHDDEERERFRAMCGVKERPPMPLKVVTPPSGDATPPGDSARNS